jgi:hypothetical protein
MIALATHLLPAEGIAARLQTAAATAWERYLSWADERVRREVSDSNRFLIQDFLPPKEKASIDRQLESGSIVVQRVQGVIPVGEKIHFPDAEIHHWWGAVLVPGVQLPDLLALLQDYDHHAGHFADVEKSRLVSRSGNQFKFFFRLRRSKSIVTAYYNAEQECEYWDAGPEKAYSRSAATRIAEIENAGTPSERERTPGDDRGFLWRLVSWWRFKQTPQGVIVECESASLSRDIPTLIKIIPGVAEYIKSTPRESLESVLTGVRNYPKSR